MIRNRIFLKAIAIFLVIETLVNAVAPTISWALTAGPTAPEATSFEPVDTTDMVNLATGDLAYNIPLLEVPGPSGGYPLSLSYHAGIQPNEDASWTGLGWTLNPGAITRNVNGFADDFKDIPNSSRYYWKGGETHTFEAGVTIGPMGGAGVTAGLSYSQDTYQGAGVGFSVGQSNSIFGTPGGPRHSAEIGVSPYGDPYYSNGVSVSLVKGTGNAVLSGHVGISTNFKTVTGYAGGGIGVGGISFLGANISSGQRGNASISIGGASAFAKNSKAGKVSVNSQGASITLPLGVVSPSLGYQYTRYWIDQIDNVDINGALHYPSGSVSREWLDTHAYDTYSLLRVDSAITENSDPEKLLGGSFPNFDDFYVHAQGLGGSFRPYYFQKHLVKRNDFEVRQDDDDDDYNFYKTIQYPLGGDGRRPEFRFEGDFSNRFEFDPNDIKRYPSAGQSPTNPMSYSFTGGNPVVKGETGTEPYTTNILPGSRHIEYLTNDETENSTRTEQVGFIETVSSGFDRSSQPSEALGAIIITNESGVKYHFALPVMSSQEYTYSENMSTTTSFNEFKNPQPYAYTWYLTALTGPDYVDRGPNGLPDGKLNDYDWGYWVEFEYGKWTDQYYWRNPSQDYRVDIDGRFKTFSEGRKELYYLDAIRTKTHTAFFVKDIRHDAKSTVYSLRDYTNEHPGENGEPLSAITKAGGSVPKQGHTVCDIRYPIFSGGDFEIEEENGEITYYTRPTSALKLTEIYLFKNSDIPGGLGKTNGITYEQKFPYQWIVHESYDFPDGYRECDFTSIEVNHHLYQNVIDVYDLQTTAGSALKPKALRIIKLETDYSLTPGTENSFDFSLANTQTPLTSSASYPRYGKLTLNKLYFNGKAGEEMIPPMVFGYEVEEPAKGTANLAKPSGADAKTFSFTLADSELSAGDIIKFNSTGYAFVTKVLDNVHTIRVMTTGIPVVGQTIQWQETKNPPYNKDAYDIWGLYKPDVSQALLAINETGARLVTPQSAQAQDVWSLRTIRSSLGGEIEIEYEPDSYQKPVLSINQPLRVEAIVPKAGSSHYEIILYDNFDDLNQFVTAGTSIDFHFLFGDPFKLDIIIEEIKRFYARIESGQLPVHDIYRNVNNKWVIETDNLFAYFEKRANDPPIYYAATGPVFIAGHLFQNLVFNNYGGGLRIKAIRASNLQSVNITSYDYTISGHTSGVTPYEPGGMDQGLFNFPTSENFPADLVEKAKKQFNKILYKDFSKLLANAREIPAPGVVYEYVTVRESVVRADGVTEEIPAHSTYQFQVFDEGMAGVVYEDDSEYALGDGVYVPGLPFHVYDKIASQKIIVKNFSGGLGSLRSVVLYDQENRKLNETINHYLQDGVSPALITSGNDPALNDDFEANAKFYEDRVRNQFNGQGIIHETYSDARFVLQDYTYELDGPVTIDLPVYHLLGVVSKREEYPSINVGQTTINYKTGITTKTQNVAFDFYTGQVTRSKNTDGYGNTFLTEVTPAYKVYSAMGLASAGGANMLTQQAATYTYKVDPGQDNERIGIVSGSVQTWSDEVDVVEEGESKAQAGTQAGIWRKRASFSYIGDDAVALRSDGLHAINALTPKAHEFSAWTDNSTPAGWQQNGEITLYDVQSHALEAKDLNEQYAATKFSYDQTLVFATAANAEYDEFAYSGAEDAPSAAHYFGGGVVYGDGGLTSNAHTGSKAVISATGNRAFSYSFDPKERVYRVSVWSSQPTASIGYKIDNGSAQSATVTHIGQAGDWHLLEADVSITGSHTSLEVWCASSSTTYFDDFRVCPVDAAMISYVYNTWGELSHILDNNNLYTEYCYDLMGRLASTRRESFQSNYGSAGVVKTSETAYNYGVQHPYLISMTSSTTGSTGLVYPAGNVTVEQGHDITFELQNNCLVSRLSSVLLDGSQINLNQASCTLYDGTVVSINGTLITFRNVQSAHTLHANYGINTILGTVECFQTENINGNGTICYEGGYQYGYFNDCGEVENWTFTWYKEFIPANLRDLAEDDCCTFNLEGSGCECRH